MVLMVIVSATLGFFLVYYIMREDAHATIVDVMIVGVFLSFSIVGSAIFIVSEVNKPMCFKETVKDSSMWHRVKCEVKE